MYNYHCLCGPCHPLQSKPRFPAPLIPPNSAINSLRHRMAAPYFSAASVHWRCQRPPIGLGTNKTLAVAQRWNTICTWYLLLSWGFTSTEIIRLIRDGEPRRPSRLHTAPISSAYVGPQSKTSIWTHIQGDAQSTYIWLKNPRGDFQIWQYMDIAARKSTVDQWGN